MLHFDHYPKLVGTTGRQKTHNCVVRDDSKVRSLTACRETVSLRDAQQRAGFRGVEPVVGADIQECKRRRVWPWQNRELLV